MSRRQKAINTVVTKRKEKLQYLARKKNNIYSRRIAVNYKFYTPKKLRTKQWVEPATPLDPLIPVGKNIPVGNNITLADILKPTPE